jgi:hypothetical protein
MLPKRIAHDGANPHAAPTRTGNLPCLCRHDKRRIDIAFEGIQTLKADSNTRARYQANSAVVNGIAKD